MKLLFTGEALSIQVHPDDAFARTVGLPHGKTEAWYVLSAAPEAEISLGLKRSLTSPQLRAAIVDGSIADLVQRQVAHAGEAIVVSEAPQLTDPETSRVATVVNEHAVQDLPSDGRQLQNLALPGSQQVERIFGPGALQLPHVVFEQDFTHCGTKE